MPRLGSSPSSSRSPTLLLLGLILISLIALSPIVYLATSSPTSSLVQQQQDGSINHQARTSWRGVVESPKYSNDDSFNLNLPNYSDPSSTLQTTQATRPSKLRSMAIGLVDQVGDLVLALFGFDEGDWFDDLSLSEDEDDDSMRDLGIEGTTLSSWSESSVYVERTQSLHPSRPSAFGPHLLNSPLRGYLYPISLYSNNSSYGCSLPSSPPHTPPKEEKGWIALVSRGQCPFSDKVRVAQQLGAKAVVFGDEEEGRGGIRGGKGLLTPWSPDDTSDIGIPSIFVSRASYLSLGRTWEDEQRIVREGTEYIHEGEEFVGLEVVLSKDEMFAWPLLDLLFLLLFLPSLLTLLTVFTQRVRLARLAKAERAPKSAVAKLVVFKWGVEPGIEKPNSSDSSGAPTTTVGGSGDDEEREIGLTNENLLVGGGGVPDQEEETSISESTSLLNSPPSPPSLSSSLLNRFRRLLHLPSSHPISGLPTSPSSPSSSSLGLRTRGPSILYPSLTDCTICLEPFITNESIVIELPCSHLFHRDCCVDWLVLRKGCCPICRRSVMEDSPTSEEVGVGREEVRINIGNQEEGEEQEGRVV